MPLSARIKYGKQVLKWYSRGHLLGPFLPTHPIVKRCRIHPTFGVAKPDGNIRGVTNLSKTMNGECLNDVLRDGPMATVEYIKLIQLVYILSLIGPGAWIWAKDLDEGFYNVRVRQDQIHQMAFAFAGLIFIPLVLTMGLTTAPFIFTVFMWYVVSAMRLWDRSLTFIEVPKERFEFTFFPEQNDLIIKDNVILVPLINFYLDDIFGFGTRDIIFRQYHMAQKVLKFLGLNANLKKDRVPDPTNILLGVEYRAAPQQICTPWCKATAYIALANQILSGRTVKKRLLFSLTGKARHMAVHCKPLAAFARGVEIYGFKRRDKRSPPIPWHHDIKLVKDLRRDIEFLIRAINHVAHSPVSFDWILHPARCIDFTAYTDAAGVHGGIGGFLATPTAPFFQVAWTDVPSFPSQCIQWQEMAAILVFLRLFATQLSGKHLHLWCDNEPVVWMLIKYRAKYSRPDLQWLIREVASCLIEHAIIPWWDHIPGDDNVIADALSRFKPSPFKHTVHCRSFTPGSDLSAEALKILTDISIQSSRHFVYDNI